MPEKPPILTRSKLTGRVYIVTAYRRLSRLSRLSNDAVEAHAKFDVTDQFHAIAAELDKESPDA